MGGDYTRFTFDPIKQFSGVRKQQGRVSLDSDFNEFEAILDRRRRAQMYDTVGSVGRAVVPMTTPNGFKIALSGTHLTIDAGRAYVDGILAECFGDMEPGRAIDRDDVLGGVRGAAPLGYDRQPFFYAGFPDLTTTANTINTVYLDVWQREVTVFEDDALREPALNGPDTATRVQTAWQVKVLRQAAASANCAATPAGWAALVAPSTARLTAKADGVLQPPPGPCEINPSGGYTGLENRLYRVEVHADGALGGGVRAKFKWSRDNASLAARVAAIEQSGTHWTITVSSTGPDTWTRFDHGDHIELIDDDVEFAMRDKGVGGVMMTVVSVDHANQVLVVDANLSAFTLHPARHPRIRRWDSASPNEPTVRDVAAGVPAVLENGIAITFDGAATDTLHAGDYWVFEARTADGSIGRLVNAPPRGTLHHFAKLGYVTIGQLPTDCRVFWPPPFGGGGTGESCCTVVVKPGGDIQAAIGSLGGAGGCVCLKMGTHVIPQALQITQDNITLHAEAPWVTVRLDGSGPLLLSIRGAANVSVLGIRFEARDGSRHGAMIDLDGVRGGRIAGCALGFIAAAWDPAWNTIGIRIEGCQDYAIEDNTLHQFATGIKGQESDRVRIIGNMLTAASVAHENTRWSAGAIGVVFSDTVGIDVERNLLTDYRRGITIGELSASPTLPPLDLAHAGPGCRIAANVITRRGGAALDNAVSPANVTAIAFAIAARMPRCEIIENAMQLDTNGDGGILGDCGNVLIARNLVSSTAVLATNVRALVPHGVVAVVRAKDALACVVRENLFTGVQQAVFVSGTNASAGSVGRVDVVSNHVAGSPDDLIKAVDALAGATGASVAALLQMVQQLASMLVVNVKSARVADNEIAMGLCAVFVGAASGVVVQGNSIRGHVAAIVLGFVEQCEVADNQIDHAQFGVVTAGGRDNVVQRNAVTNTHASIFDLMGTAIRIQDNDVSGGRLGIELFATADGEVHGNRIADASETGLTAVAINAVTVSHNKAIRCGYRKGAPPAASATGIRIITADANVLVESCHAIDIGGSPRPADPLFQGRRFGIVIGSVHARVRVHGCTITGPSIARKDGGPGAHPASRALLITGGQPPKRSTPPKPSTRPDSENTDDNFKGTDGGASVDFADAADNLAEQTATPVVEITTEGDIMFAANRCRLLDSDASKTAVVELNGSTLAVTGNRVRAHGGAPSLVLNAATALTAVGNVTTSGADIAGVPPVPAPYNKFNVTT